MKRMWSFLLTAGLTAACSGSNGPGGNANVQVSFATQRPVPASPHVAALTDTLVTGADTLVITRAEIVLREIELEGATTGGCAAADDDDCQEIEFGPVLVDLPTEPGARQRFAVDLPEGTYTEVEFELHKPDDDDPADAAFLAANPAFADISVRVEGTFNGQPFVFVSDVNEDQEIDLVPPLSVIEGQTVNLTIFVDLGAWFRAPDGSLIDPATANKGGQNEGVVADNVKASFEAFEDDDHDGDDDDDGDD